LGVVEKDAPKQYHFHHSLAQGFDAFRCVDGLKIIGNWNVMRLSKATSGFKDLLSGQAEQSK